MFNSQRALIGIKTVASFVSASVNSQYAALLLSLASILNVLDMVDDVYDG